MSSPQNRFILRPLELKHLFDFAIRLLRFNFLPMFLSMAMVQLPLALLSIPMTLKFVTMADRLNDPTYMNTTSGSDFLNQILVDFGETGLAMAAGMIFAAFYQLLVTPLGLLTCARLASRALLGYRDSFREAFSFALSRYWPTQVALATYFLPTVALSLVVLIIVVGANAAGNSTATIVASSSGLFLITAAVLGTLAMYFRFFPALSGVLQATEDSPEEGFVNQGVWYLKRSYGLTEGYYARVLGYMFLLSIAANMIHSGIRSSIEMLVALYDYMSSGVSGFEEYMLRYTETSSDPVQIGITLVLLALLTTIFPPYWQCFKLLLYTDIRCRKEALDIYMLLEDEHRETAAPAQSEV